MVSVSSTLYSPPTSLSELNTRLDLYVKKREITVFGLKGVQSPQSVMCSFLDMIPQFKDLRLKSLRTHFLNKIVVLLPSNCTVKQKFKCKSQFMEVFNEIIKFDDPIEALQRDLEIQQKNIKNILGVRELCAAKHDEYNKLIEKLTVSLRKDLDKKKILAADFSVFMKSLVHLGRVSEIIKVKDVKIRLKVLSEIETSLNILKGTELSSGFISAVQIEITLLRIKVLCLISFEQECFRSSSILEEFCMRHKLSLENLTPEAFLKRGLKAYIEESRSAVRALAPAKSIPIPEVKEKVQSDPVESNKAEVQDDEKDDDTIVFQPAKPLELEEFPFPFDNRVLRWDLASLNKPLDPELFPEYDHPHPDVICFHKFSHLVDMFFNSGLEKEWKNKKRNNSDALYLVPGEIEFRDGRTTRGAFAWCVGADGVCYHRWFEEMNSMAKILDTFQENIFYEDDFPEMSGPVLPKIENIKPVIQSSDKHTLEISPDRLKVTIFDPTLGMKIKLHRLKV